MSNITQKWVNILIPFTNNYGNKFTGVELARLSNTPQQTVSRYLKELSKQNLVNYIRQGRNKLFYLDSLKQSTKIILEITEAQKALNFHAKLKEIFLIINQFIKYSETIVVFGSYASHSFNKSSDLDLVFLGDYNKKEIKKIKQKQIIQINEHYISYQEFAKLLKAKNPLALEIFKNHVLFGNIYKLIETFLEVTK